MKPPTRHIRGFALVSAIFILVVLAALGAFILSVSSQQQIGSALDVQGVRAYQAARAGIEWGLYQVQSFGAPPAAPSPLAYNFSYGNPAVAVGSASPNLRACPASPTSFAPVAPMLAGMTVTVICTRVPVDDTPANNPNNSPAVYEIVSTACSQPIVGWMATTTACPNTAPGSLYIERRLSVTF